MEPGLVCSTTAYRTTTTTTATTQGNTTSTVAPVCSNTEFSCGGSPETCIPSLLLCDSIKDCGNGLDEQSCPSKYQNLVYAM